ncbi:MAG: hypothetical protein GEU98_06990 [Pseudonocardiaceae bacterium]|nr:hypothetical protein [Pseudonocardiaceae bacterium]
MDALVIIAAAVAVPAAVVGAIFLARAVLRYHEGRNSTSELHYRYFAQQLFAGAPEVTIDLGQWDLNIGQIQAIAVEHGYVEVNPPRYSGALTFQLRQPTTAVLPAAPTPPKMERELIKVRDKKTFCWLSSANTGLSPQQISTVSAGYGLAARLVASSQRDAITLVSRQPVGQLWELRQWISPFWRIPAAVWQGLGFGLVGLSLVSSLALPPLLDGSDVLKKSLWVGAAVASVVGLVVASVPFWGPKTTRLTRLVAEFSGKNYVTVNVSILNLPDAMVAQIASQFGYVFVDASIGSRLELHGRKITFIKQQRN